MNRKKLLVFPFPLLSHYLRCLRLTRNIKDWEIHYAGFEKYNHFFQHSGVILHPCKTFDPEEVMACSRRFSFDWINRKSLTEVLLAQISLIEAIKPDIILSDAMITTRMGADHSCVPVIALQNGYMTPYYTGKRSLPASHPAAKNCPEPVMEVLAPIGKGISEFLLSKVFKSVRRALMINPVRNFTQEMQGDRVLICDDPFLYPQKKLPDFYEWIGPLYHVSHEAAELPIDFINETRPVISFSFGSTGDTDQLSWVNQLTTDYRVVWTGKLPSFSLDKKIVHLPFADLGGLLKYSSLLVCHGGSGTVSAAVDAGVPILAFPSHFEQEWCTNALVKAGVAVYGNKDPLRQIKEMLGSDTYQQHLKRLPRFNSNRSFQNVLDEISEGDMKPLR